MTLTRKLLLCLLPLFVILEGCSTQALFDTLGPKDGNSRRVARDIAFGGHDQQKLDVYAPRTLAGKAPVLVYIYGGSWRMGDKNEYDFAGRAFAGKGYVTVIPDYRKVPEVVFPSFLEDGASALKWVTDNIAEYGGDPSRIYLVGHSAGAYNAVMLAVDPQFLAAEGLGPDTIDGVTSMAGPHDFYPFDVQATIDAFGAAENPETTTQPVALVTPDAPPMFLLIGSDDTVVQPRNVPALAAKLEEAGVRVETKIYDGLNHIDPAKVLSVPFRRQATVLADIDAFFRSIDEDLQD